MVSSEPNTLGQDSSQRRITLTVVGLVLLAGVVGCTEDYSYPSAIRHEGYVIIHVTPTVQTETVVTVRGQSRTWTPGDDADGQEFLLPLGLFEPGTTEIEVVTQAGGRTYTESVEFEVPDGPQPLFARVHSCNGVAYDGGQTRLTGTLGDVEGPNDHGARLVLEGVASPGAEVAIGNQTARASEDGLLRIELDIAGPLGRLPILADGLGSETSELEVVVAAAGRDEVRGTATLSLGQFALTRALVRAARAGQPLALGGLPQTDHFAAIYHHGDPNDDAPRVLGAPGTFGDLRYVAVGERLEPRENGLCGGYRSAGGMGAAVPRREVDLRLTAYDIRTGQQVGQSTIRAPDHGSCPDAISGTADAVLIYPRPSAVQAWLETL